MPSGGKLEGVFEWGGKRDGRYPEPVDGGQAVGIGGDVVAEVGSFDAQVVFGGGENAFVFVRGISYDKQAGAGRGYDANGATAAMESVAGRAFIEMAYEEDGTIGILSQVGELDEEVPHLLIIGHTDGAIKHGDERIDDDQDGFGELDALHEDGKVSRQGEMGKVRLVRALNYGQETNARGITADGEDARFDGASDIVFWGDEDNVTFDAGRAVGHGLASGDASGEIEGDEGFAEVGVAVEDGDVATQDAFVPEPVELVFLYVGEGDARCSFLV